MMAMADAVAERNFEAQNPGGLPLWPAPYNEDSAESCYRFVTERCWTYNEANSAIALIPSNDYVRQLCLEWWEARSTGKTLIIEKSRRLVVSWILRGCELWAMGIRRTKNVIAGLNYPKAAEHVWRIWHLWTELSKPHKDDPTYWTLPQGKSLGGDPMSQTLDMVMLPNGSNVQKLNQDGGSFQGSGYSCVTMEEFSLYDHPASMLFQASIVVQGKPAEENEPESIGGFVVIVTNPAPNKEWQEAKMNTKARDVLGLDPSPEECLIMGGFAGVDLPNDTRYLAIHFSADPLKNYAWALREKSGKPKREWDNQMELHEDIYQGEPVHLDYNDNIHCPPKIRREGLPVFPKSVLFGGWDIGLQPAFTLDQVTTEGQILRILEVTSDGNEPMSVFAPRVAHAIKQRLPGRWNDIYHVGDATIVNRSQTTGDTVQMIARKFGFNIRPMTNILEIRLSAVAWALTDWIDEKTPRFMIDPIHCPVSRDGFKGAYRFQDGAKGDTSGPGRIIMLPLKNGYSHVMDSGQYNFIAIEKFIKGTLKLRF